MQNHAYTYIYLQGVLVLADPVLACDPIAHAPNINDTFFSNITTNTIALIKRGPKEKPCGFSTKVCALRVKFFKDKS